MMCRRGRRARDCPIRSVATSFSSRATPSERAQWEPDPGVRYELAARIAAEAKATREEAQRTLKAAERIMKQARGDET